MAERIITLIAGSSGSGKSFFVANLKRALIYDTDIGGGLSYADARIKRNGSERIEVSSYPEILNDLKAKQRSGALKDRLFVVIDHLSTLQQEGVNRHNPNMERDFGMAGDKAAREWRRIREFCRAYDFNLVCTAHLKAKWEAEKVVGQTAEASKNVEGDFQQFLHVTRASTYPSVAWVQKWRRDPEDPRGLIPNTFPFTVEAFEKLAGSEAMAPREPIKLASEEQIKTLNGLLEIARLPEGTVEKWLKKAGAEAFSEMGAADIQKCIDYINGLISGTKPKNGK